MRADRRAYRAQLVREKCAMIANNCSAAALAPRTRALFTLNAASVLVVNHFQMQR